jgi:hypothetical protein
MFCCRAVRRRKPVAQPPRWRNVRCRPSANAYILPYQVTFSSIRQLTSKTQQRCGSRDTLTSVLMVCDDLVTLNKCDPYLDAGKGGGGCSWNKCEKDYRLRTYSSRECGTKSEADTRLPGDILYPICLEVLIRCFK